MENWTRTFLKRMEQEFASAREDVVFLEEEGENPATLRQLFNVGSETLQPVVTDLTVFHMEDGAWLLQIYTEIAEDVEEEYLPGLMAQINDLNLPVPLGAFGYFREERQLYHKYNLLVEEPADMEAFVNCLAGTLEIVLNIVGNCYEELYALTGKE